MAPNPKERVTCSEALKHKWFAMQESSRGNPDLKRKPSLVRQPSIGVTRKQRIGGKAKIELFLKSKYGKYLCMHLDRIATGDGPPHHVFPSKLSIFHRKCLHMYCEQIDVQARSVDRIEPPGRLLVAWRGSEPADLQLLVRPDRDRSRGSRSVVIVLMRPNTEHLD